jgi:ABC-2 type transport system ATP-binding protein
MSAVTDPPTIVLDELTQRFDDVTALDGVDGVVPGGRILGLVGRNGSGKTTLLSIIAALRRPTSGEVRIDGRPVWENAALVRDIHLVRGNGDAPESDWPDDRVEDVLGLVATLRPAFDAAYARRLLDALEVPLRSRLPKLSTGKRSAVGIAIGLATRAPVTMFDESTVGLDAPSRYAFYEAVLAEQVARPRTLLLSTHLIEEVERLFESVLLLDRGRILAHDEADALRARGAQLVGPVDVVEDLVAGVEVLDRRRLGPTLACSVYGLLDDALRSRALAAGVEVHGISLQDLVVHLTGAGTVERLRTGSDERSEEVAR